MRKVKDIMNKAVITVAPGTPIRDIAMTLADNHLTGLPVVDNGKVVGIVTEADLVTREANIHMPTFIQILDGTLFLGNAQAMNEEMEKIAAKTAQNVMSHPVITVSEDADIHELATTMLEEHANPVPVLDEKDQLVGVVSRSDLVKLIAEGIEA